MAYRIAPTGVTSEGPIYLYGYSFAINDAKTVQSITLPRNRNVVVLAVAASGAAGSQSSASGSTGTTPSSSSSADNVVGIVANGSSVSHGGLDDDGYAYSATLLGSSITWAGSTFALGPPGVFDAISGRTVSLSSGSYSAVNLLATAVNGDQRNQTFIVSYTDGTTESFTQSLSDWGTPQQYAGESKVSEMAYRLTSSGATSEGPYYLYGYSFAINNAKTVTSITLPNNRNVVVLAVGVSQAGAVPLAAAAPGLSPGPGTYAAAQTVKLTDSTSQALIYYTTNGATPTTSSSLYNANTPLQVSSTTTIKAIAVVSGYSSSAVIAGTYTIASAAATAKTLQISGTPATTAVVGQFYSFTPTVVASTGSSLTYLISNKPAWATFNAASGALSGTPISSSAGTDSNIIISVSNGSQSAALSAFSIDVAPAPTSTSGSVDISWTEPTENTNGTPLTNLAGYVLRYGTNSTALTSQISIGAATTTDAEIENLSPGVWYFEVAAVNSAGVESPFSSIVSKTIQ
jgi:hypothetical protein